MPVDWVNYYVEAILRMIILLVTVQHLIIIPLDFVNTVNVGIAFDFLGVGVLRNRYQVFVEQLDDLEIFLKVLLVLAH